jgi:hypothetical protein
MRALNPLQRLLSASFFAALVAILSIPVLSFSNQHHKLNSNAVEWHVPTYKGIRPGKSKRADVWRAFGKPIWSGHPEDELDAPIMNLIRDEFENVGGFRGRTSVDVKRRSKIVDSIELRPFDDKPFTVEEATARFGKDYLERDDRTGPCPTRIELLASKNQTKSSSTIWRVYPKQGLYLTIQDDKVSEIVFLTSCP